MYPECIQSTRRAGWSSLVAVPRLNIHAGSLLNSLSGRKCTNIITLALYMVVISITTILTFWNNPYVPALIMHSVTLKQPLCPLITVCLRQNSSVILHLAIKYLFPFLKQRFATLRAQKNKSRISTLSTKLCYLKQERTDLMCKRDAKRDAKNILGISFKHHASTLPPLVVEQVYQC